MSYVALDIFQQLRQEDTHWILASAELSTVPAGGVLVREDDPSETIFFVADGLLDVQVFAGHQIKVGQLGPGEVVGEISWLDRRPASATVRAAETSTVLALSTALLERRLAEDPVFAARLFRGLATLAAERLRKTTAQVRRAEWSAAPRSAAQKAAGGSGVLARIAELKALAAAAADAEITDGRLSDDYAARMRKAFEALERATGPKSTETIASLAGALQAELLPFIELSETGDRLYMKPRGYAADWQTIEIIYRNQPRGSGPLGTLIDACILQLGALEAIRNRRSLMAAEIRAALGNSVDGSGGEPLRVASLACGPAREIFDVFERIDDPDSLAVSAIDVDREALTHVNALARQRDLSESIRTLHANLIYLATGRQELDLEPQDLIYSLGLVDSVSDEAAVELIDWMHGKLKPGGRVMLGSFHPRNPSRGLMDTVLDWRLVHRDEAAINALLQRSKFAQPASRVVFEQQGIVHFAERRRG